MTIICFRDGILAADQLTLDGYGARVGYAPKIFRIRQSIFGISGRSSDTEEARRILMGRECPLQEPEKIDSAREFSENIEVILVSRAGVYLSTGKRFVFKTIEAPFFAIGCAAHIALGAMWHGATAEEAVQAAIGLDTSCGGVADVLPLVDLDPASLRPAPPIPPQFRPQPEAPVPTIAAVGLGPTPVPDVHFGGPR